MLFWYVNDNWYSYNDTNIFLLNAIRPFQGLFRHIAGGAKHWGERAAKPWLPYILLVSER
jgi:hypothetical protein